LAVLERFLSVREARTGVPEYWEPMFGTHPRHVVEALVQLHLLESATLAETIEYGHTGAELKKAPGRPWPQSQRPKGRTSQAPHRSRSRRDAQFLCRAPDRALFPRSEAGRRVLARFLARALESATDELIAALGDRQFKTAIQIADAWRAQVFSCGSA
jgi:hypothetical protein